MLKLFSFFTPLSLCALQLLWTSKPLENRWTWTRAGFCQMVVADTFINRASCAARSPSLTRRTQEGARVTSPHSWPYGYKLVLWCYCLFRCWPLTFNAEQMSKLRESHCCKNCFRAPPDCFLFTTALLTKQKSQNWLQSSVTNKLWGGSPFRYLPQ